MCDRCPRFREEFVGCRASDDITDEVDRGQEAVSDGSRDDGEK